MRRNLFFGDVRFEDDVRTAKEIERRQWLDDLQKQIEDNKRQKLFQYETDRRKDFLNESVQPIVQEAANRQQQLNNSLTHDAQVQQTYEEMLEANNAAKYEKRLQLIEKLKRSGHQTDQLVKTLSSNRKVFVFRRQFFFFSKTENQRMKQQEKNYSGQRMNQLHNKIIKQNMIQLIYRMESMNNIPIDHLIDNEMKLLIQLTQHFEGKNKTITFSFYELYICLPANIVFLLVDKLIPMHKKIQNYLHKLPILTIKILAIEMLLINQAKTIFVCVHMKMPIQRVVPQQRPINRMDTMTVMFLK